MSQTVDISWDDHNVAVVMVEHFVSMTDEYFSKLLKNSATYNSVWICSLCKNFDKTKYLF